MAIAAVERACRLCEAVRRRMTEHAVHRKWDRSPEEARGSMRKRLVVVILNYRTAGLSLDCLESLQAELDREHDLVVLIDNGSGDDSAEQLAQALAARGWRTWIRLVQSQQNVGFPAGCNIGLRETEADYYLLLNNDTIVRKGAIRSLLRALDEHSDVGIVGPRLEWPDGKPQVNARPFISPWSQFRGAARTRVLSRLLRRFCLSDGVPDGPVDAPWLSFACALLRRQVIEVVGLLDDGYFLYFDDVDYCRRAWETGWRVLYWPEARVVHLKGGSNPTHSLTKARLRRPEYYYASRARYLAKFYGRVGLWAANLLWMAGRLVSVARELLGTKRPHTCEKEWRDIWTNCLAPLKPPTKWRPARFR